MKKTLSNLFDYIKEYLSISRFVDIVTILFLCSLFFWHGKVIHLGFIGNKFVDLLNVVVYPADILLFILGAFYFVKFISRYRTKDQYRLLSLYILALVGLYYIFPRGEYSIYSILRVIEYIACFMVFRHVKFEIFAKVMYFFGLAESILAILQFHLKHSIGIHFFGEPILNIYMNGVAKIDMSVGIKVIRAYGTFNHPNSLAALLLIAIAGGLFLSYKFSPRYLVGILIMLFGLTVTFSRAGYLGMFVFFVIASAILLVKKFVDGKKITVYSTIILVFVCSSGLLYGNYLSKRATIEDYSTYQRVQYDKYGLEIMKASPIFGVGLGQTLKYVAKIVPTDSPDWAIQPPHNYLENVSDETGFFGLLILLALFVYIITKSIKKIGAREGDDNKKMEIVVMLSLFLSLLIIMQFDHYFYDVPLMALLFWSFIGIIFGAVKSSS